MAFGNGPRLVTTGLDLLVDAADQQSYPGTGTVWTDLRSGTTGSLTGSVSYTSEFYGGLTFSDSSSAVIFPGSTANYGTGSFTIEMAFKPSYIEGKHYLMSKNSGSFPNWSIYLSGSNNEGKLWSEFNIDASVSCSVSSSTTFETGSVYQVDVRILPAFSASGIYVNGQTEFGDFGNGGGSLTTTGSLFVGNYSQDSIQNFSGSIYTIKTYLNASTEQPVINYNATSTRFSKPPVPETSKKRYEILIIGGGGGGSNGRGGGGGAGGFQYINTTSFIPSKYTVIIGSGGVVNTNGQPSYLGSFISYGGGAGGIGNGGRGSNGASGGGGGREEDITSLGGGLAIYGSQGNIGASGSGTTSNLSGQSGGGGGGAGSPGFRRTGSQLTPDGGSGSYVSSFTLIGGSPAGWFAGGGGGSGQYGGLAGFGGIGGGGNGGLFSGPSAISGSPNTGGGGGGIDAGGAGTATGGSGIVAIRYSGTPIALGGEITQSEGYTYHVFRTVGTSSFTIF
jgi:hypothetical protein